MATTKAVWTVNQSLRAAATLAAGVNDAHSLNINNDAIINGSDLVVLQFNIAHGASTGVTVELFSSPDNGVIHDTESLAGGFSTSGADVIKTVTVMGQPHIRVSITNDDGTNATGNISVLYAARKWETA